MKRLLAALLTFFALLALTGCGGSSSDGPHLLLYYPAPSGGPPAAMPSSAAVSIGPPTALSPPSSRCAGWYPFCWRTAPTAVWKVPSLPAPGYWLVRSPPALRGWISPAPTASCPGMELTIADYCVTLSLSQIVGIYSVRITVNGTELIYRDSNIFLAGDVLMTSQDDVVQNLSLRLYFPDRETGELTAEERLLTVYEGESQAEVILSALKAGPESESLSPLLPTGFAVLTVRTEGGICYLNLPKGDQYLMPEDETEQQRMVQGLVNSLCSARGVRQIQLLLDGEVASSLGSVEISQPFSPIR